MAALVDIEGIGPAYAAKLNAAGVTSQEKLLEMGATPKGRKEIAEKSEIPDTLILKWINHCDLIRIKGIGAEYAEILEASGIDTVPELAHRKPDNLLAKMQEVNEAKKLVRQLPTLKQVTDWVEQAKVLPRIVNY
jgi:predicted flap endonuclease-1-like 5' DNA nuclease